jgi:hypothetical protein
MNRLFPQANKQSPEVRYRYAGRVAGHVVAGEIELPNKPWAPQAGLLLIFRLLHEGSGLSFETMEKDNAVQWQLAA